MSAYYVHSSVLKSIARHLFPSPFPRCKNTALSRPLILINLLHSLLETMACEPTRKAHWPGWNDLFLSQALDLIGTDGSCYLSLSNLWPLILSGVLGCKEKPKGSTQFPSFPFCSFWNVSPRTTILFYTKQKQKQWQYTKISTLYPSQKQTNKIKR